MYRIKRPISCLLIVFLVLPAIFTSDGNNCGNYVINRAGLALSADSAAYAIRCSEVYSGSAILRNYVFYALFFTVIITLIVLVYKFKDLRRNFSNNNFLFFMKTTNERESYA